MKRGVKLTVLARRFLNLEIDYLGFVPRDPSMIRAVKEQKPVDAFGSNESRGG